MRGQLQGFGDAVVTPHVLATQAGLDVLALGGTAADAMIAADAMLGVVAPEMCGIGGDLFALVWTPGGDVPRALNASGPAGSAADPGELRGEGHRTVPSRHPLSVTVPGCVAGWFELHAAHGRLPMPDLLAASIAAAEDGFPASASLSSALSRLEAALASQPSGAELYPDGSVPSPGSRVRRPKLAATLRRIADLGLDGFVDGPTARAISEAVGGRITPGDLRTFRPEWTEPLGLELWGRTGWTVPPNSQGYVALAALGVFGRLDPPDDPDDPIAVHLLVEAVRSVAWEAPDLVADPTSAPLPPARLLEADRLDRHAAAIDRSRAGRFGPGPAAPGGTAALCAVDADGMGVTFIQSNYMGIGSTVGAGDAGFLLHNRGAGFDLRPGHPNELAPGRRPFHTLSPTLWTRDGALEALLGTRGGRHQPQLVAQVACRLFGAGATPEEAQDAPRWTIGDASTGTGSELAVEGRMPAATRHELEARGHRIQVAADRMPGWGPVALVTIGEDGLRTAAPDPRVDTATAGVR